MTFQLSGFDFKPLTPLTQNTYTLKPATPAKTWQCGPGRWPGKMASIRRIGLIVGLGVFSSTTKAQMNFGSSLFLGGV